jgi:hypothetical protein
MNVNSFKITGKLHKIYPLQQISDKFAKQEFVLDIEDKYQPYIKFQATQQYTDQLNRFEVGQEVEVSFNLQGREWEDKNGQVKYFNSLNCWKIELAQPQAEPPKEEATTSNDAFNDSLPF